MLCVAYAVGADPFELWKPGEPVPEIFLNGADFTVVAHNAAFERAILRHVLMPAARLARYSRSSAGAARWRWRAHAHCPAGSREGRRRRSSLPFQKDAEGAKTMRALSKPGPDDVWIEDPELLERLYAYCRQDVEVERALSAVLPPLARRRASTFGSSTRPSTSAAFSSTPSCSRRPAASSTRAGPSCSLSFAESRRRLRAQRKSRS